MKYDIILCGVGGQGVLSVAAAIATASSIEGLKVRQSEVHGMAQRGGAVLSHLRISDAEIPGDLVPKGSADLILSMEPLESLRYLDYLKPNGSLITGGDPYDNIPNYPEIEGLHESIDRLPKSRIIPAKELARQAKNPKASNMVLVGAASSTLPLKMESLKKAIELLFQRKGKEIIEKNLHALDLGANS
ncbi:MAG: indolepyruvate oxidoreductase subunit beta [Spirochaetaceae bacterium]|nr:indolepyruvate oxidoreductase subunit beta [Spirochaetaceae bacterium]